MRLHVLGLFLVLAGTIAACSGNIGGGSSAVPGAGVPGQVGPLASAVALPSGTPSSASGTVNVAPSAGPQTLPNVGGYTASIAFPQTTASPTTMDAVSSLNLPQNVPAPFDLSAGKRRGFLGIGKGRKGPASPYKALLYISLVPAKTVTFDHLPQLVFGIPQGVVASLGDKWDVGLGFYDPDDKSKKFKLAIADRIAVSTPPTPISSASATPAPTPSASPAPNPSGSRPGSSTPTPVPTPTIALVAVGFAGPAIPLTMQANKVYVFVLYGIVAPAPRPTSGGSAAPSPSNASASPAAATVGPSPSGTSVPGGAASATPAPSRT